MAFFNLTLMGYDNRFNALKRLEPTGADDNSGELRKVPTAGKSSLEKQLMREMTGDLQSREWTSPAVSNS
jgi:hypothetical protein